MVKRPQRSSSTGSDLASDERTIADEADTNQRDEPNRDGIHSKSGIDRRSYLKLLGISTAPLAAGHARASEGGGYGAGGYGQGGYGGNDDGNDDSEGLCSLCR